MNAPLVRLGPEGGAERLPASSRLPSPAAISSWDQKAEPNGYLPKGAKA